MHSNSKILITGSSGLIGGEVVDYFASKGFMIFGIDNNQRESFFGKNGSTQWNLERLRSKFKNLIHHNVDIRNREKILNLISEIKPNYIIHTAAQPSHDKAASIPFEDFETNAVGTLNLLEAVRQFCPESPFVHMSTNKVYGDSPNNLELKEYETRWDFVSDKYINGINEQFTIDQSKHSLFGASKVASDILVQEYGRYFNIPTCCLRGGCLTGPNHSGVELHGFLSYLIKSNISKNIYTVYGYKAKQVRDNIHSFDVASFIDCFLRNPRIAEVYNLGGGKENSISMLEAFNKIEKISNKKMNFKYSEKAREGDHIVYYSDLKKMKSHFPRWEITKNLDDIFEEIYINWCERLNSNL